jgi:predicted nucleic acid-binding Zn ribbon protein
MGESLDRLVRGLGAPSAGVTTSIFADWGEIVGEQIAAHCRPATLRERILTVTVTDPGWATQLRFLEGELLGRIATATGSDEVIKIEVRVRGAGGFERGRTTG